MDSRIRMNCWDLWFECRFGVVVEAGIVNLWTAALVHLSVVGWGVLLVWCRWWPVGVNLEV